MLKNQSVWYLYIIRTQKNHLYTGITTDVERRFNQHTSGKGAKALRGKGPLTLVYQLSIGNRSDALKLEYRIKRQNKLQKEQLVKCQPPLSALFSQLLSD